MSRPPACPEGADEPESNGKTDRKPATGAGEKDAMEEAQEDAAEERATEGGYQ